MYQLCGPKGELMDALQKLIEIEEIKRLKASYFRHLDGKCWQDWKDLFTEDCVAEFLDEPPGFTVTGSDALLELVYGGLKDAVTIHHGHMPEIDIISPSEATGIWSMQDWLHWPEDVALPQGVRNLVGLGHYHERYRKTEQGWRISFLSLTRLHVNTY
jgi:hypothetical protein